MTEGNVQRLGAWLEQARLRWGLTRRELHERSGVSPRHQLALLNGEIKSLRGATVAGIAKATGVDEHVLRQVAEGADVAVPDQPPVHGHTARDDEVSQELAELRAKLREMEVKVDLLSDLVGRLLGPTRPPAAG